MPPARINKKGRVFSFFYSPARFFFLVWVMRGVNTCVRAVYCNFCFSFFGDNGSVFFFFMFQIIINSFVFLQTDLLLCLSCCLLYFPSTKNGSAF